MADIYKDFDLGAFDEELRGKKIKLLQNPTYAFRNELVSNKGTFTACVARVIGTDIAGIETVFGEFEDTLFMWLFVPIAGDDGKIILPYIYTIWDEYMAARVKALRAPLAVSSAGAITAQG